MRIHSGIGNGKEAGVDKNNRLMVEASTRSAQARVSIEDGQAFQVSSSDVAVSTSEQEILVIKNNYLNLKVVVTYIRVQTADVAARNAAAFWTIGLNEGYVSGGTAIEPVNVNTDSGFSAQDLACYDGSVAIVTSGTFDQIDRNFGANTRETYNKEGALVVGPGGMLSIKHIGSTIAGVANARVSFYLTDNGGS